MEVLSYDNWFLLGLWFAVPISIIVAYLQLLEDDGRITIKDLILGAPFLAAVYSLSWPITIFVLCILLVTCLVLLVFYKVERLLEPILNKKIKII